MKRLINHEHYAQIQNTHIQRRWTDLAQETDEMPESHDYWNSTRKLPIFDADTQNKGLTSFETFIQQNPNEILSATSSGCRIFIDERNTILKSRYPPGIDDKTRKAFILLNEAGSGKTTYLTWLAHELFREPYTRWIIKLKLIESSFVFSQYIQNDTIDETAALRLLFRSLYLAFLAPDINSKDMEYARKADQNAQRSAEAIRISKGCVNLESKTVDLIMNVKYKSPDTCRMLVLLRIFRIKFENKQLYLLMDGFDEIVPTYKKTALGLLSRVDKFEGICKLYLTSRPYGFRKDFEKVVKACSFYRLEKFLNHDILHYIYLFVKDTWKTSSEENRAGLVRVLYALGRGFLGDMAKIPLCLTIGLELLRNVIQNDPNFETGLISQRIMQECKNMFEPMHMMETFIEKKLKIAYLEKTSANVGIIFAPSSIRMREFYYKHVLRMHSILAMYLLFEENVDKLLPVSMRNEALQYMEEVRNGSENSGIIEGVVNNKPRFNYHLFAEFCAASWLFSNMDLERVKVFVKELMYGNRRGINKEIRYLLNRLVCRNSPIHMAILDRSIETIGELLRTNKECIHRKDLWGRSPLQLAFAEMWVGNSASRGILELLVEKTDATRIHDKDDYFGWCTLKYARIGFESICANYELEEKGIIFAHLSSKDPFEIFYHALKFGRKWATIFSDSNYPARDILQPFFQCIAKKILDEKHFDIYSSILIRENSILIQHYKKLRDIRKRHPYVRTPLDYCVYFDSLLLESLVDAAGGPDKLLSRAGSDILEMACKDRSVNILWYLIIDCKFQLPSIKNYRQVIIFLCVYMEGDKLMFRDLFHKYCKQYNIECLDETMINVNLGLKKKLKRNGFRGLRKLPHVEIPNAKEILRNGTDAGTFLLLKMGMASDNADIFKYLILKTCIDINIEFITDLMSNCIYFDATWSCSFHFLLEMIENLHGEKTNGQNLLHIACMNHWFDLVKCLIVYFNFDALRGNARENNWNAFFYCVIVLGNDDDLKYVDFGKSEIIAFLMENYDMDCFGTFDSKGKSVFKYALEGDGQVACSIMYSEFIVKGVTSVPERSACLLERLREAEVTKEDFRSKIELLDRNNCIFGNCLVDVKQMQEILSYEMSNF